jgi:enoyl-CoA hydratase/carnithine racemase
VTLPLTAFTADHFQPKHFAWTVRDRVATITLNRPERKNPLTFESYAELRDLFRDLVYATDINAVVVTGAGGNFCSGGDVHEIIGPLIDLPMPDLLRFTRMTGDLVKAMRACPQPIVAAIDGICAGAGACIAMASDIRFGTVNARVAVLFTRVGRASELLFTGRSMGGEEAERWGFFNQLCTPDAMLKTAQDLAHDLAHGPTFAHGITKKMLHQEWNMGVDEAIEAEAEAQAICMETKDFERAYRAFVTKQKPVFEGN